MPSWGVYRVWICVCWKYSARSEDITTNPHSQPDSLFSRSDLNQFTNSIMLSLNTGWEMMNDYVKHIISPLHHHSNMTAKFHSSYPISSLFKERKLLVPVIRYVVRLCELSPLPLGFLLCLCRSHTHTHTHVPHVWPSTVLTSSFTHFKDHYLALIYSLQHHPLAMPVWNIDSL